MPSSKNDSDRRPWILRDSREKIGHGFHFDESTLFAGTKVATLRTADYQIEGQPGLIAIERKGASHSEFVTNLVQPRFEAELARLQAGSLHNIVLCEFDFDAILRWPEGAGLSQSAKAKVKTSPGFLIKRIAELSTTFPSVKFLFVGTGGEAVAYALLKAAYLSLDHE